MASASSSAVEVPEFGLTRDDHDLTLPLQEWQSRLIGEVNEIVEQGIGLVDA